MDSIENDLDTKEYIILNDSNIIKYNLKRENLYSYDKKTDVEKEIFSEPIKESKKSNFNILKLFTSIIKGGDPKGINYLTTYYNKPDIKEQRKMLSFIDSYSPLNAHIPFKFMGDIYYIEYTARKRIKDKTEKLIISICLDREHKKEIIHISCFPNSFIHLTFIINDKHYKIYQKYNPDLFNRFNDIFNFILNCNKLFEIIISNKDKIDFEEWNRERNNNWKNDIINDDKIIISFHKYIMIFLECIRYLVSRPFFINTFYKDIKP
jgi:hypothetical protein